MFVADRIGQPGEYQSGYLFDGSTLTLAWREAGKDGNLPGFGTVYDRITHHLGFEENFGAGKTMALAGLSNPIKGIGPQFFSFVDGNLQMHWPQSNDSSQRRFRQLLDRPGEQVLLRNAVAATLQAELEGSVIAMAERWVKQYQPSTLLFSGGLATNCKLVGAAKIRFPEIRVQGSLAPNDLGQGIGNLAGVFFRRYGFFPKNVSGGRRPVFFPGVSSNHGALPRKLCEQVTSGKFLLFCHGDHEPGPRALGFHSLLADARDASVRIRINEILGREAFRPFGAVMTASAAGKWFGNSSVSPYMDLAMPAPTSFSQVYPAVVHADGSVRVQAIGELMRGSLIEEVLALLEAEFDVDLLLNTSLNRADQPIAFCADEAREILRAFGEDSAVLICDESNDRLLPPWLES